MDSLFAYADDSDESSEDQNNVPPQKEAKEAPAETPVPKPAAMVTRPAANLPPPGKRKLIGSRLRNAGPASDGASFVLPLNSDKVKAAVAATNLEASRAAERDAAAAQAAAEAKAAEEETAQRSGGKKRGLFSFLPAPKRSGSGAPAELARAEAEAKEAASIYGNDAQFSEHPEPGEFVADQGAANGSANGDTAAVVAGYAEATKKKRKIRSLRDLKDRRPITTTAGGSGQPSLSSIANAESAAASEPPTLSFQQQQQQQELAAYQHQQRQQQEQHERQHGTGPRAQAVNQDAAFAGLNLPASFHREFQRQQKLQQHAAAPGQATQALLQTNSVAREVALGSGGFKEVNMASLIQTTSEEAARAPKTAGELGYVKITDQRKAAQLKNLAKDYLAMGHEYEERNKAGAKNKANSSSRYGW